MPYEFRSHQKLLRKAIPLFPWLFLVQIPEGLLSLLQKYFETQWSQSPKLVFAVLYPLFCGSASFCSALTYGVLKNTKMTSLSLGFLIRETVSKAKPLILTSLLLGLIMIPATLALILPGILVLSFYQFVPFCVADAPRHPLSFYFGQSKDFFSGNRLICLITAFLSFFVSLLSYLGLGLVSQGPFHSGFLFVLETLTGMLLSVFLTTWTATLYQEVSK